MSSNLHIILTALEGERHNAEQSAARFASAIAALQNGNGHKPTNGGGNGTTATMSARDVAQRVGVGVARIYQLAHQLGGKKSTDRGHPWVFDAAKVEKFAESREA